MIPDHNRDTACNVVLVEFGSGHAEKQHELQVPDLAQFLLELLLSLSGPPFSEATIDFIKINPKVSSLE